MSDERLRRLRRAEHEDPQAAARAVRAALRAGDLDSASLRLAAFAGDPASLAALAQHPVCRCGITRKAAHHASTCPLHPRLMHETPDALRHPRALRPWLRALQQWPQEVGVRGALAVIHALWTPACVRGQILLHRIEDWASCPCAEHLSRALPLLLSGPPPTEPALQALSHVRYALRLGWERDSQVAGAAAVAFALERCAKASSEALVRDALREALVPWALGRGDPLAARIAAR